METRRFIAAWIAAFGAVLVLDALWLGLVATGLYQQGIGHLMAAQPRLAVAAVFYLGYPAGVALFAALPSTGLADAARRGALFGLFCYGTYDITNWATLKDWPAWLALLDMAWGCTVSAAGAAAARRWIGRTAG